ncbi:MAG: restriction endonuclease subunit S [Flavobacteriales bacterium]|nr:restriction endonuclease subunit S [Flavobacteriales bacterium]
MKKELTGLPKGWSWRAMEDVADVIGGATPKTGDPEHYESGNIAWLTPADLSGYTEKYIEEGARFITKKGLESCSTKLLPKGTVLFTSRAPIGYVAIASGEVCTNQGFKSFVLDESQVTSDYVYWWLKGAKSMAEEVASGTTFLELSTAKAKKLPIPVAPLPEQRRIVEAIERQLGRLDAAVSRLHAAKAKLKRYKQAVLKAAVEGDYADTPQEEWKEAVLGDIAVSIRNGYSKKPDAQDGIRIFRISAVRPLELFVDDVRYLDPKTKDHEASLVAPGDVLFTRYNGSRDMVGACALVPDDCPPTVHPDKLIRVRVPNDELLPGMLAILGTVGEGRDYIESKIRTTAGQSGISGGDLKSLPLRYPPVKEQKRIIREVESRLSGMEVLESTLDAQLQQAVRLRQAVLKRAFEGRLV